MTDRNIDRLSRQLSEGQYINTTEFGNISTSVQLDISFNGEGRNKTALFLYGWMFEDVNVGKPHLDASSTNSVVAFSDGGIYAEMLVNQAFQDSGSIIGPAPEIPSSSIQSAESPILPFGPVPTGWRGIDNVSLGLILLHHLSDALPVVLEIVTTFKEQ